MAEENTRELIIKTVMETLESGVPPEKITTRMIAAKAGVGIGLVNYHFQTKDHLIGIALRRYTEKLAASVSAMLTAIDGTPKQKLIKVCEYIMARLISNPTVARAGILRDLESPGPDDNTQRILSAAGPLLMEVAGGDGYWSRLLGDIICFTCEAALLRADTLKATDGIDLTNGSQRNLFVDDIIETLLQNFI